MRFSLYALQFGKELLEVKSKAEQKQFSRDICFPLPRKYETHTKIIFFMIYIHHSGFFASGDPYEMLFLVQQRSAPVRSSFCTETFLVIP